MTIRKRKKQAAEDHQRRLLRLKDGAKYLSVSPGTLRRLIQQGEIPVIKIGDGNAPWLIDLVEINAWIERSKERL